MRTIFFALAAVVLMFTISPAFCASSPTLKEVGLFADEHVGKTFTFTAYISTDRTYLRDSEDGTGVYGIMLLDEDQKTLTIDHVIHAIDSTNLYTSINRKQVKELIREMDSKLIYKRKVSFKVTKEKLSSTNLRLSSRV